MRKRIVAPEPEPSPEETLRCLLDELAPTEEASSEALARILTAIDGYHASKPYRDESGVRRRGSISEARKSLVDLEQALAEAASAARGLKLEGIRQFCKAYGAPLGSLMQALERAREAASTARKKAEDLPDKSPDHHRSVLAMNVARVFERVLQRSPKSTRDVEGKTTYTRGGAAYARVLRATFAIAGLKRKEIGPDIDAGLRLFREIPGEPQDH